MIKTYTAFVRFPNGDVEEIDVKAEGFREARMKVQAELDADYLPNGEVIRLVCRPNGVLFF